MRSRTSLRSVALPIKLFSYFFRSFSVSLFVSTHVSGFDRDEEEREGEEVGKEKEKECASSIPPTRRREKSRWCVQARKLEGLQSRVLEASRCLGPFFRTNAIPLLMALQTQL